jgi:hypothetical protein
LSGGPGTVQVVRNLWQIAWAAGFFEGEGTITRCGDSLHVRVSGTDLEPLEFFQHALQLGGLYGPYTNTARDGYYRKPFWVWCARNDEAKQALRLLLPWLSERRRNQLKERVGGRNTLAVELLGGRKLRRPTVVEDQIFTRAMAKERLRRARRRQARTA